MITTTTTDGLYALMDEHTGMKMMMMFLCVSIANKQSLYDRLDVI